MKTTFAILFSLLLAVTQVVSLPVTAESSNPPACGNCTGCKMACCARSEAPVSQPATPASNVSGNQSQLLLAVLARLIAVQHAPSVSFSPPHSVSPFPATTVPLYQENCSYLI